MHPILFAGDPHGNFSPLLRACLSLPPGTVIVLGDLDLERPLAEVMAPLFATGWQIFWILGNHDADTESRLDHLAGSLPEGDIGNRVVTVEGRRIAGLSGVFKPRVWVPATRTAPPEAEPPRFETRTSFLASLPEREHWRGGLPLWHRDTIFPEDFTTLARQRFDILVSHEAPSSHPHGMAEIDRLARAGGARLIVHGHHHTSYRATLEDGIGVRGLGVGEIWPLEDQLGS
ncbi:MAG: metallophosphoesterase [Acetobacteraceae bacterium]|nr:metallophosphoesterase [Acetobacteraceae bacterium]